MKITIVLPWYDNNMPSGGILNVYGYAKRLADKGHIINIVYDCCKGKGKLRIPNYFSFLKRKRCTISKQKLINSNITEIPVFDVNNDTIPDADFVFATALVTVFGVEKLSARKGKKVYFIQGFENWGKTDKEIFSTYSLGMINITVSKWLFDLVSEHSKKKTYYLPNAIDDVFSVKNPIENRIEKSIGFMYVPIKSKGTYDLLNALDYVHKKNPDVIVEGFGIYPPSDDIPSYVKYTYCPSRQELEKLYNRCSVFVCASWLEGFGLTAAESMKCGCCLVTTDCKGVLDFAIDKKTAFICEPRNIKQLSEKINYIINNKEERIKIAKAGEEMIKKFSWENAINEIERILNSNQ